MRSRSPALSIVIPPFQEQHEEYGISIHEWCLQGCGQQCQEGSKYCSQKCFREALLNQDMDCVNEGLGRSCHTPLSSATAFTARSDSPYSPKLSSTLFFPSSSISSAGSPNTPIIPLHTSCALALFSCSSATENLQSVYECLKLTNKPNRRCAHHAH